MEKVGWSNLKQDAVKPWNLLKKMFPNHGLCNMVHVHGAEEIHGSGMFWAFSTEPFLEEGAASIFSRQLCAPFLNTSEPKKATRHRKRQGPPSFWPMGLSETKANGFHGKNEQTRTISNLTLGGGCVQKCLSDICLILAFAGIRPN